MLAARSGAEFLPGGCPWSTDAMTDPLIALSACSSCRACDLATTRQQVVVGRGNPNARLMLIGEAWSARGRHRSALRRPIRPSSRTVAGGGRPSTPERSLHLQCRQMPPPWKPSTAAAGTGGLSPLVGPTALLDRSRCRCSCWSDSPGGCSWQQGPDDGSAGRWQRWQGRDVMPIFIPPICCGIHRLRTAAQWP